MGTVLVSRRGARLATRARLPKIAGLAVGVLCLALVCPPVGPAAGDRASVASDRTALLAAAEGELTDLQMTASSGERAIALGGRARLRFVVRNEGDYPSGLSELWWSLPSGLRLERATLTPGRCASVSPCRLEDVDPGSTAVLTLVVKGASIGSQVVVGNVTNVYPFDSDPGNNYAAVEVDVRRRVRARSYVSPQVVERDLVRGGRLRIAKSVRLPVPLAEPAIIPDPHVVVLVGDNTDTEAANDALSQGVGRLVDNVHEIRASTMFGVASFGNATLRSGPRTEPFRVEQQPLSGYGDDEITALELAFDGLNGVGGGGGADDWGLALHEIAKGSVHARPGAARVVVLVAAAPTHEPSQGRRLDEVIGELAAEGTRVVVVPTGPGRALREQASAVADGTGGLVTPMVSRPQELVDTIASALARLPAAVSPIVQCDDGITFTWEPTGETVAPGGSVVRLLETVRLSDDVTPGTVLRCRVDFDVNRQRSLLPGYVQRVRITVTEPDVVVDPTVVREGTVAIVRGSGFPAGSRVRLTWSEGIAQPPIELTVARDGTFFAQALVLLHDRLGHREVLAVNAGAAPFADAMSNSVIVSRRPYPPEGQVAGTSIEFDDLAPW